MIFGDVSFDICLFTTHCRMHNELYSNQRSGCGLRFDFLHLLLNIVALEIPLFTVTNRFFTVFSIMIKDGVVTNFTSFIHQVNKYRESLIVYCRPRVEALNL